MKEDFTPTVCSQNLTLYIGLKRVFKTWNLSQLYSVFAKSETWHCLQCGISEY